MRNKLDYLNPRREGSWAAKMAQMTRAVGYNKDVDCILGIVTSAPPELRVRLDNWKIELDKDDLIVAEHLTNHKRYMTIRKSTDPKWTSNIRLASSDVGESMTANGMGPHTHDITKVEMNGVQNDMTVEQIEVELLDELKVGDRVFVISYNNDQAFFIADRAHFYG